MTSVSFESLQQSANVCRSCFYTYAWLQVPPFLSSIHLCFCSGGWTVNVFLEASVSSVSLLIVLNLHNDMNMYQQQDISPTSPPLGLVLVIRVFWRNETLNPIWSRMKFAIGCFCTVAGLVTPSKIWFLACWNVLFLTCWFAQNRNAQRGCRIWLEERVKHLWILNGALYDVTVLHKDQLERKAVYIYDVGIGGFLAFNLVFFLVFHSSWTIVCLCVELREKERKRERGTSKRPN